MSIEKDIKELTAAINNLAEALREIYRQSFSALNLFGLIEAALRDGEP